MSTKWRSSSRMLSRNRNLIGQCTAIVMLFYLIYKTGMIGRFQSKLCNCELENVMSGQTTIRNRTLPLIFIGGVPRSGTTLMRALLDSHADVRCGEETRLIPRILSHHASWLKSEIERNRIKAAGISDSTLNSAISAFMLQIMIKHGESAPRICNKDPFVMKYVDYLHTLFPNAKFIFMVRDGRAVVNSIIERKITISGFNLKQPEQCLKRWNTIVQMMSLQCKSLPSMCMMVHYEKLVLEPLPVLREVLSFLDLKWDPNVLHHESFINKPGGISLSKFERSTDQVIKPVNTEALSKWVKTLPQKVKDRANELAPMLSVLGYNPFENPPFYGKPSNFTENNNMKIKNNSAYYKKQGSLVTGNQRMQNKN